VHYAYAIGFSLLSVYDTTTYFRSTVRPDFLPRRGGGGG